MDWRNFSADPFELLDEGFDSTLVDTRLRQRSVVLLVDVEAVGMHGDGGTDTATVDAGDILGKWRPSSTRDSGVRCAGRCSRSPPSSLPWRSPPRFPA
jgi:hypothetical protein